MNIGSTKQLLTWGLWSKRMAWVFN